MKQNLLNKVWLRVWMLVAIMTTALAGTAWADTKTYDFRFITMGDEGWSSSYEKHSKEYDEGTVIFSSADKNSQTITTMPVTKGQPVEFVMKEGYTISAATFTCQQWGTKAQTITLHYSTDGGENYISTGITSSNFTITSDELPDGTNAVKITFSSTSNQIGIKSLDLTYTYSTGGGGSSAVATTTTIDATGIKNTDVYTSTEAGSLSATVVDADNNAVEGASVTWNGNNDAVATIDASTGVVTLVAAGTVKFTAAYAGVTDEYYASSATYEMTVTDSTPFTGGDVTFAAATDLGTSPITKNGVTFACSSGALNNGSEYRLYKNSETTFSLSDDIIASGYVIKSIAFTCTGGNPASGFAEQEGWETDGNNGTWTGAATSVTFTASNSQVRATEIVVTVGQAAALSSITLSGDYPTTFHVGDAFSHEGIVVTATYEDASTRDVTASATFSEPDMKTMGVKTVTVSYSEGEVTKTATYDIAVNAPAALVSISLSGTYPTEFQQGDAFSSEGIVVTAYYDDNTTADVTAEAAFFGYDMDVLGEQTVTVSYEGQEATYTITVVEKKGTATNPYTVAEARAAIDAGTGITGVYATGIVSKIVTAYNSQYGNISYNISEDGTETADQLQAYRGFSYNGDWFTSADDIQVGDVVVVYGNLKKYNSTYEFDSGNQLVSLDRPVVTTPSITVDPATVNAPYTGTTGTINVTYNNVYPNVCVDAEWYTDATCATTTAAPSWIEVSYDTENNVTYTIQENDGSEARTAYMKIWSYSAPEVKEYSEVITFSQAAYVVGYATLPFWWSGGKADIESTAGLSQEGLGSDYSNSPKLKFDSTGDWLLLQFNERPSKLSFEIKGNPSGGVWAGTFTVQTSEDGVTYTDLKSYTELTSTVKSEPFDNLGENVRYIKWVYTEKVSGNVALGNIVVDKYSVDPPAISISPITVNVDAVATEGTLDIRLDNITISDMAQFEVRYLTSSLESTTQPEWLDVVVAEQDPSVGEGYVVSYTVLDNDGKARSAYFQVYGLDDDGNTEALSQVVTIEQAEYVAPVEEFATLPFVWEGSAEDGKSSLEAMAGVTANGLGTDYAVSNAPYRVKLDGTGDYIQVQTDCQPVLVSLDVKMLGGGNTSTITVQESNDGTTFTDVEDLTIEGTQNDVLYLQTASAFDAATRYVRLYFTKGSNVGVGGITIEKEFEEIATVGAAGYATYVTKHNVAFPADVAYIGAVNENMVSMTAVTAAPKGTPLILKGEGTYTLSLASASELADVSGNELKASETDVVADGTQYILAKPANEPVGFYQATGTIPAGKAYLVVPSSSVKAFYFSFDDDADGIEGIDGSDASESIYNLAGQRIQKMQRGINIVGGKKIAVK